MIADRAAESVIALARATSRRPAATSCDENPNIDVLVWGCAWVVAVGLGRFRARGVGGAAPGKAGAWVCVTGGIAGAGRMPGELNCESGKPCGVAAGA